MNFLEARVGDLGAEMPSKPSYNDIGADLKEQVTYTHTVMRTYTVCIKKNSLILLKYMASK